MPLKDMLAGGSAPIPDAPDAAPPAPKHQALQSNLLLNLLPLLRNWALEGVRQ